MRLDLFRNEVGAHGVFGWLYGPFGMLATVEDDWRNNQPSESCIPAGDYNLERTIYHKHGYETFEVTGVPNRSRILIHVANTEEDVKGCIGVGLRFADLVVVDEDDPEHKRVRKRSVASSKLAFNRFMEAMNLVDDAELHVVWPEGFVP